MTFSSKREKKLKKKKQKKRKNEKKEKNIFCIKEKIAKCLQK